MEGGLGRLSGTLFKCNRMALAALLKNRDHLGRGGSETGERGNLKINLPFPTFEEVKLEGKDPAREKKRMGWGEERNPRAKRGTLVVMKPTFEETRAVFHKGEREKERYRGAKL